MSPKISTRTNHANAASEESPEIPPCDFITLSTHISLWSSIQGLHLPSKNGTATPKWGRKPLLGQTTLRYFCRLCRPFSLSTWDVPYTIEKPLKIISISNLGNQKSVYASSSSVRLLSGQLSHLACMRVCMVPYTSLVSPICLATPPYGWFSHWYLAGFGSQSKIHSRKQHVGLLQLRTQHSKFQWRLNPRIDIEKDAFSINFIFHHYKITFYPFSYFFLILLANPNYYAMCFNTSHLLLKIVRVVVLW